MFWADSIGSKYIYSRLDEWSKTYGDFFKPCAFLAERGSKGAPLVSFSLLFLARIFQLCARLYRAVFFWIAINTNSFSLVYIT